MYNIIGRRNIFLTISAILVLGSIAAVAVLHFREGIEFTGGTLWQFKIKESAPSVNDLGAKFNSLGITDFQITNDAVSATYLVRLPNLGESDHQKYLGDLKQSYSSFEELGFQSIGPSIGKELRQSALIALVLVLIAISLYIAFAFRKVSRPISSWKYGWVTLLTLLHDIAIPAGLLALLGYYGKVEIDTNFVVALLVVAGFSVHDTIVVFDRIRENLTLDRGKTEFGKLINDSVNQTLARSVNTSLTLILVLLALYFMGPVTLKYFILTLLVGVTTGIYSSVCVASPVLYLLHRKRA